MTARAFRVKRKSLADLNKFGNDETQHVLLETTEGLLYMFHGRQDGTNTGDLSIVTDPDVAYVICCHPALTNFQAVWEKIPVEFRNCKMQLTTVWERAPHTPYLPFVIGTDREEAYDLAEATLS